MPSEISAICAALGWRSRRARRVHLVSNITLDYRAAMIWSGDYRRLVSQSHWLAGAAILLSVGVGLGGSVSAQSEAPPDLSEVIERLDHLFRGETSRGTMELVVTTPRRTRTLRMNFWARGLDRTLVVIDSPARERGTATLRVERNLWNFLPRISRTIRVPPSMMLGSWMGSDFTNDDLVQGSSYEEDFEATLVGPSTEPAGWLVRFDAREGVVARWKRIDFIMNSAGDLPLEARYYDRRLRLARTMRFDEVRTFGDRRIPARLTLQRTDEEGSQTVMRYLELEFDVDVPESMFSLSRLERGR